MEVDSLVKRSSEDAARGELTSHNRNTKEIRVVRFNSRIMEGPSREA